MFILSPSIRPYPDFCSDWTIHTCQVTISHIFLMHLAAVILLLDLSGATHKNGSTFRTLVTVRFLLLRDVFQISHVGNKMPSKQFQNRLRWLPGAKAVTKHNGDDVKQHQRSYTSPKEQD